MHRKNAKIKRLISSASFRSSASPEAIELSENRGLDKKTISELSTCRFIDEGKNILILGATGVGKSYIATALGLAACRQRRSTIFLRMNTLIEKLSLARVSANYLNQLKKYSTCDLLILDDFGIKPLQPAHYQDFYDILEERFESKSTIITSQVPEQNWNEIIDDQVTCEAVTRRITEKAIRIQMKGDAYAKRKQKS